jgi:CDP-glycerol glycerophosphotransferase
MTREVGYWDYLLAQNEFSAQALPQALGYGGRVIAAGYPRNDALQACEARRHQIRERLGLPSDRLAVLYAPTWRDNVRNRDQRYALVSYLDFDAAIANLPDATFLLRGHSNTVANAPVHPAVRDVTAWPDIAELLIAADVLVTDYSSVMFDFCIMGRPILLLVPDLVTYRDATRGFYLDLAEIAPGPLCLTSERLVEELRRLDDYDERFGDRYRAFAQRFASLDDGQAARRVVDQVWGRHA